MPEIVTMGIGSQPNVILSDEQLQTDSTEPGKESGISTTNSSEDIPKKNEADNLQRKANFHERCNIKNNEIELIFTGTAEI